MVNWEAIKIQLLPEERQLILEYGYPFPDAKKQLQRLAASDDIEVLIISQFYLQQMIGDLSYSINKRTKGRVQYELNDLCDRLEYIEQTGDGKIDFWFE